MYPQDPVRELADFLSALPAWQKKLLECELLSEAELDQYAAAAGTPEQMFDQEATRRKYESLLQKLPVRWQEYVKRKKKLVASFIPKGAPGRPPDHETLEQVVRLRSQGMSLRQIAVTMGAEPAQIPSAIDRYRKLIASARKRSKRGTNPT